MPNREESDMGRFSVEFTVANNEDVVRARSGELDWDEVRKIQISGVVDSGAARLVLPKSVANKLGLEPTGKTKVRYADQRTSSRDVARYIWLELLGREGVFSAIVEPKRDTALIGAIVLEELDLVVDCTTNTLHPRDPKWIISEIE